MVHLRPAGRPYGSSTARWKAVRFILRTVSRAYGQLGAPFGRQPRRHLGRDFIYISFVFYGSVKAITEAMYKWFYFQVPPVYNYSTCCTNRVLTRSVHQVRVYAFGAPTTRLRVQCTPEALTNQGGGTHQYIDYVVCFNTEDSHHPNKHTILHVFRARGYDSIVSLS